MTLLVDPTQKRWATDDLGEMLLRSCLVKSIDAAFENLLGAHASRALYDDLERKGINRRDIPDKLDLFCSAIEDKCGRNGGFAIQRIIAERLYARLGVGFAPVSNAKLSDYVGEAKKNYVRFLKSN